MRTRRPHSDQSKTASGRQHRVAAFSKSTGGSSTSGSRRAADQGDARAQNNLGVMYATGQGVLQDAGEAVKWFRRAADQGDARAQNNLGVMYANGQGVARDFVAASNWLALAEAQGYAEAHRRRDRLVEAGWILRS